MKVSSFAVVCAFFLSAGTAVAQPQEPVSSQLPTDSTKERRLDLRVGAGVPMFSLSVVARPSEQPFTIDAGLWAFAFMGGGYLRAGWALGLADHRDGKGRGSTLELTPMLGVLVGQAGDYDDPPLSVAPEAVASLDWTWWFSRRFGVGATATLGGVFTGYVDGLDDLVVGPDARLAVGVSF